MPVQVEGCENCGGAIGRLEAAYLWQNHVVCRPCYERLAAEAGPVAAGEPEAVLWSATPSVLPHAVRYVVIGGVLVGGVVGISLLGWVLAPIPILAVLAIGSREWRRRSTRYTITRQRVIRREGYWRRRQQEIRVVDILEIQLRQGAVERLLGVGTVEVATAATAQRELKMANVPKAAEVVEILRRARS